MFIFLVVCFMAILVVGIVADSRILDSKFNNWWENEIPQWIPDLYFKLFGNPQKDEELKQKLNSAKRRKPNGK